MPISTPHSKDLRYQLALLRAPRVGPLSFRRLMNHFKTAEALFAESANSLQTLGISSEIAHYLKRPDWKKVDHDLCWLEQPEHHLVSINEARYPFLLKQISAAPNFLFIKGNVELLQSSQLAIVGTRNPTPLGREMAHYFSKALARSGLTITSGLALGIDATSHQAALLTKGKTIAVLGNGLDTIYPKRHYGLAARIQENGALVSEFPLEYTAHPKNFPRRNRIISGLSLGTLVIEASLKSGSLITAKHAADQGREVFAIPGSIHNPLARGCHALLQQGAKLVETPADVLDELDFAQHNEPPPSETSSHEAQTTCLDEDQKKLLECIGFEATPVDQIIARSEFPAQKATPMLLIMELRGYIVPISGGYLRVK